MKDSDWKILYELFLDPNLTRTANRLYMTQPSLTKRLQRMEEEFQVEIVNRTPKGLEFTPAGEYLAGQAEIYLDFQKETQRRLQEFREGAGQEIVIGSSYTFSKIHLPGLLMHYNYHHPDIRFSIVTDQSDVLFRKAVNNEVDVAFIHGDYDGMAVQTLLGKDPGYLVTWESVELSALPGLQRIVYKTNDRTTELLTDWWQRRFGTELPSGMSSGYVDVALQLVHKGFGYTLCFLPKDYEDPYDLCLTPLTNADGSPLSRNTWMVRSKKRRLSGALQEFVAYVERTV